MAAGQLTFFVGCKRTLFFLVIVISRIHLERNVWLATTFRCYGTLNLDTIYAIRCGLFCVKRK